jgi:cobalt-zinc-cadmium efflux system outer membrane protein
MYHLVLALLVQGASVPADSISLDQALRLARTRRPDVSAAAARVGEASARRRLTSRPPNPTVEYSSVAVDDTRRLSVTQALSPVARLGLERSAASALVDAARADSVQRLANMERDVTRAFYGALAGEVRVRLLRDLVRLADSLGSLATKRAQAGDISELDQEQFSLEAVRARLQLSNAQEERASRLSALGRQLGLIGAPPPVPAGRLDEGLRSVDTTTPTPLDDVPELRRARAEARAAARAEHSLRWARIPVPGLLFERDWSRVPGVQTITRLGLSVPLPIFSQGNEALDVAASRTDQAEAQAAEIELEVGRALATARVRVTEASHRAILASDSLLVGVVRLREGAVRLYDAGRTSVLQVLEALRAERDAQLVAVDGLLAFQEARADLAALLGRPSIQSAPPGR